MYATERQQLIADVISAAGRVSVTHLAARFDVTTETVRRDLTALEERGILMRVHGGAVVAGRGSVREITLDERVEIASEAKQRIAQAALRLIPDSFEGSVALDAGSTTGALARELVDWTPDTRGRRLVIVTHAVPIANTLRRNPDIDLLVIGGRVRGVTSAAVGFRAVEDFERLRPDVAFIGLNGVSVEHGLSTPDDSEAAVKAALVAGARRVIALVDSSKFGEESLVRFAELSDLDVIVTDAAPSGALGVALAEADVEVVVA